MSDYQLSVFFGTPVVVAMLAWGMVGLHRLLPRPIVRSPALPGDNVGVRSSGLPRVDQSARATIVRKHRKHN